MAANQRLKMKGYCAWWGPDRKLRLLRAKVDESGNAHMRRGPKTVKVVPDRCGTYRGKPVFQVIGTSGEATDIFGNGHGSLITSIEYDEAANNSYASQVFAELGKNTVAQVRDWIVLGAIALLLIIQIYSLNETKDAIGTVGRILAERLPAPPPAAAISLLAGMLQW